MISTGPTAKAALIPFFLIHYGIFWLVHGVFVWFGLPQMWAQMGAGTGPPHLSTIAWAIPVIVLSGGGLFGLPLEVQQTADALLEEPVLPDRLLENVRNLLWRCRVPGADPTIARPESG